MRHDDDDQACRHTSNSRLYGGRLAVPLLRLDQDTRTAGRGNDLKILCAAAVALLVGTAQARAATICDGPVHDIPADKIKKCLEILQDDVRFWKALATKYADESDRWQAEAQRQLKLHRETIDAWGRHLTGPPPSLPPDIHITVEQPSFCSHEPDGMGGFTSQCY